MSNISKDLYNAGEYYAGALLEFPEKTPLWRYSYAWAIHLKHFILEPYDGGMLYPCGLSPYHRTEKNNSALLPDYSYTYRYNRKLMMEKVPDACAPLDLEFSKVRTPQTPHVVGGNGFTHSFLNYRRILKDGLLGYRSRIDILPEGEFRDSLILLLDAIECYRLRCITLLKDSSASPQLIHALENVPNNPPKNCYEALVAWNFMYYIDGCDNIGGLERGLLPYWNGENIVDLLHELYKHIDINEGWSEPLGPNYNPLTVQCIKAVKGIRRPSIQLLVTENMPEEIWEAAYETIESSCGQPAFYNWNNYLTELKKRIPQLSSEDINYLAFGGCTETMIEGLSNVGSDDAGINTALIFDHFMREHLYEYSDFDSFLRGYLAKAGEIISDVIQQLESYRKTRALYRPQPIRTLFVDDCIDKMSDFNAGGARYNWSVINVAGLINVIDSMAVIKKLIFDDKIYTVYEFLKSLENREPVFLQRCKAVPKHGNNDPFVDEIAHIVSESIYSEFEKYTCTPGGKYFAVSNQFSTYCDAGRGVRSTPDGRNDNDPLCDSCGPVHGNDHEGPTAMLNSVSALKLNLVIGTPITNIRISKNHVKTMLKPLVEGFFHSGGVELQVTCASKAELLEAVKNPKDYENLIVRIGGYSEYFTRLTPDLQQTVIDRTEY